jgi:hypothetical protein
MYSQFRGPRALRREDVSLSSDSLREAMKTREPFWIKAWAAISLWPGSTAGYEDDIVFEAEEFRDCEVVFCGVVCYNRCER